MPEILATLEDVNANLPADPAMVVVEATEANTDLLQISIARVVRGYLSRVYEVATLVSWDTPQKTPEIIREVAAKLIAAQLYFNKTAEQSTTIEENSFAQKLYDEAIALLNSIIGGDIIVPDIPSTPTDGMSILDGFPIDDTDRSFTMGMNL